MKRQMEKILAEVNKSIPVRLARCFKGIDSAVQEKLDVITGRMSLIDKIEELLNSKVLTVLDLVLAEMGEKLERKFGKRLKRLRNPTNLWKNILKSYTRSWEFLSCSLKPTPQYLYLQEKKETRCIC